MRFSLLVLFIFLTVGARGEDVVSFGHNLSATSNTLKGKNCAVGFPAIACRLSDDFMIASSTWLAWDYKMASLFLRYKIKEEGTATHAVQFSQFYADNESPFYSMSASWLHYIFTRRHKTGYTFHFNAIAAYYYAEDRPFSLRRPNVRKDPTDFSVTTLHEFNLLKHWYFMAEGGVLGFTRYYPNLHYGASMQWRNEDWLLQFGFTNTGPVSAIFSRDRNDYYGLTNGNDHGVGKQFRDQLKHDFSVHPEIVVQYYF